MRTPPGANADPHKGPGAPKVYSGTAIQCALVLKPVFKLSLRSTQGFVSSLLELIVAVEVTRSRVHDSSMLPGLLS